MNTLNSEDKVDLLIVGSGASASVFAAKAAQAGKQVLMLEAGPERRSSDLISSQIWARRLKWGGSPVEEEGNLRVGYSFNAGYGTGGSALHHYGVWPRLHENDFALKTQHKLGNDWPFAYAELQTYYDRIQSEVGISGDATQEVWRPPGAPYPMPPLPVFPQGNIIARGFKKLGKTTAPIPLAINSQPYHGRQSCLYDGWCDAGCPNGALANPLTTYLPLARKAKASIRHNATVTRILSNDKGDRATGVVYRDEHGGTHTQWAEVVVLAAFAIENPRLLLVSANSRHPQGLGNDFDQVGRYLMTHPAVSVFALFEDETYPYQGVTGGQLISQDGYNSKDSYNSKDGINKKRSKKDSFGSYQWLIANAMKPNDLLGIANSRADLYGEALEQFMQKAVRHMATMVAVGEDIPQAENRVTLSQQKDQFGLPVAKASHNLAPSTRALAQHMASEGKEIMHAAGATETWAGATVGMHIMGGTIMGNKVETSVTNAFGQCHGINNLIIAGPGLFPSCGAVNPTFTIHALALRSVEHLLSQWASLQ